MEDYLTPIVAPVVTAKEESLIGQTFLPGGTPVSMLTTASALRKPASSITDGSSEVTIVDLARKVGKFTDLSEAETELKLMAYQDQLLKLEEYVDGGVRKNKK